MLDATDFVAQPNEKISSVNSLQYASTSTLDTGDVGPRTRELYAPKG